MNKKDLEALGIEDEELAQKIIVLHGKDIEGLKTSVSTLTTQLETANGQLTEANTTIEGFKTMDVEGIKKAADDWKVKAETLEQESAATIKQLKLDHAVEGALTQAKAKNIVSVKAHLAMDKIAFDDKGELTGVQEQLDTIREKHDYLFESDEATPQIVTGSKGGSVVGDALVKAATKAAGLRE